MGARVLQGVPGCEALTPIDKGFVDARGGLAESQ